MPRKKPRLHRVAMGSAIFLWRRVRQLKQQELAELCDWPKGRVSKYETGSQWPDDATVQRIARALEIERGLLYGSQALLLDHLRGNLDEADFEDKDGAGAERGGPLPDELQRRWNDLLRAEADLARRRLELEYATRVAAAREAATGV